MELFSEDNIKEFLRITTNKIKTRECYKDYTNTGRFEEEYHLTMEDVRYYFTKNEFFFNPVDLLNEYLKVMRL